jgi:hypothetical protein
MTEEQSRRRILLGGAAAAVMFGLPACSDQKPGEEPTILNQNLELDSKKLRELRAEVWKQVARERPTDMLTIMMFSFDPNKTLADNLTSTKKFPPEGPVIDYYVRFIVNMHLVGGPRPSNQKLARVTPMAIVTALDKHLETPAYKKMVLAVRLLESKKSDATPFLKRLHEVQKKAAPTSTPEFDVWKNILERHLLSNTNSDLVTNALAHIYVDPTNEIMRYSTATQTGEGYFIFNPPKYSVRSQH